MSIYKIEQNLYTLYKKMASLSDNVIQQEQGVSWVNCHPQKWPYTLFGSPSSNVNFSSLAEKIKQGIIPPYWIMLHESDSKIQKQFKANSFRLMAQWPGMAIDLSSQHFEKTKAQKVSNLDELKGWLMVLNQTLFSSNPLDENIMGNVFDKNDSIHFYIYKEGDQVVSAGLSHDTEDTSGFYTIATLASKRGKGFGTSVTQEMLFDAKERKINTAVLQATPMGAKIYTKLGFQQFCIFDVYWLLGVR